LFFEKRQPREIGAMCQGRVGGERCAFVRVSARALTDAERDGDRVKASLVAQVPNVRLDRSPHGAVMGSLSPRQWRMDRRNLSIMPRRHHTAARADR
jgi:hypothetical protein